MQGLPRRRSGLPGLLALTQKCSDFRTLRGGKGATKSRALQRCGGRGESQRLPQLLPLGDSKRKGAVEHVACTEGIDGVDREGGGFLQLAVLVEPDGAARPARARQERLRQLGDLVQRLTVVADVGGLLQRL